jgi:hypothetical protein
MFILYYLSINVHLCFTCKTISAIEQNLYEFLSFSLAFEYGAYRSL